MYKGDIPFDPYTGQPMYYPESKYAFVYNDVTYKSWYEIEKQFGEKAVEECERIDVPPDWRPNVAFNAVMTINSFSRGRSAANFNLVDANGIKYTMFMTDMLDLLQGTCLTMGTTECLEWCFCKRGQNYGIKLVYG